jgi:cbb3-type cytochrome oxidase subunit 3
MIGNSMCLTTLRICATPSYSVYIAILIFYFVVIFFTFPETKRLSAEEASMVFDLTKGARMRATPSTDAASLGDERGHGSLEYDGDSKKLEAEIHEEEIKNGH